MILQITTEKPKIVIISVSQSSVKTKYQLNPTLFCIFSFSLKQKFLKVCKKADKQKYKKRRQRSKRKEEIGNLS